MIAGVVLAGGRSHRFGRDKASALLHGRPLIAWSLATLARSTPTLAVNGPEALAQLVDLPAVADAEGLPPGPLAGVLGALAWAREEGCSHLLTVPCDTPFLPENLGSRLMEAAERLAAPVVAARAERPHPLCALWRTDAAAALLPLAAAERQPPLHALIDRLGGAWADFPDELAFANLNTEAEMRAAGGKLRSFGVRHKND